MIRKKDDPPGGTTGRVGCGTGWMRRPCRTQIHNQSVFERSMPSDLIRGPAPDLIRGPAPNFIRLGVAVLACMPSWTERLRFRFECAPGIPKARLFTNYYMRLGEKASNFGAVRKRLGVEFVDVSEQFAERSRAVIDEKLAFFR